MNQELIAFIIVGMTSLSLGVQFYRRTLAEPFALRLLKLGRVKWAMRIRSHAHNPFKRQRKSPRKDLGNGCSHC